MNIRGASIVIATRNRRDDLLRAVESSMAQTYRPCEVLVIDDASGDDSVGAVGALGGSVKVLQSECRVGYIANRNRGFREATGDVVFSIDDDAYFADADVVARTMRCFEERPDVGAVAIPFIEPLARRSQSSLRSRTRAIPGGDMSGYTGCAHAIRRDLALDLGGYREFLVHQGEERDLCIRMRDAGWRIVYGNAGFIVHMVSPKRDADRVSYYGIRNQILFEWLNTPLRHLPVRLVWSPIASLRYRFTLKSLPIKLRAIWAGFSESVRRSASRRPVSPETYRQTRALPGHGPEDWSGPIPPPCGRDAIGPREFAAESRGSA